MQSGIANAAIRALPASLAVQVDSGQVGQASEPAAAVADDAASELGPQDQFVASRSPSAQLFVRLILECWADKRHGMDWLLLPEGPSSKYLLTLHSFDATENWLGAWCVWVGRGVGGGP